MMLFSCPNSEKQPRLPHGNVLPGSVSRHEKSQETVESCLALSE